MMKLAAQGQSMWSGVGTERRGGWQGRRLVAMGVVGAGSREVVEANGARQGQRSSAGDHLPAGRSNQEWLDDLRGPRQGEALSALRRILLNGLRYAMAGYRNVREDDLEDFVQEASLRILAKLNTFRGESRFVTWAQKIAVHVALTELRRKRWQDVSLDSLTANQDGAERIPAFLAEPSAGPERRVLQGTLVEELESVISQELTQRQQRALMAVYIHGVPLEEVARRMGTNRNALYKLLHDARRRLKECLQWRDVAAQEIMAAFGAG